MFSYLFCLERGRPYSTWPSTGPANVFGADDEPVQFCLQNTGSVPQQLKTDMNNEPILSV